MPRRRIGIFLAGLLLIGGGSPAHAETHRVVPLQERTDALLDILRQARETAVDTADGDRLSALNLSVKHCERYPYGELASTRHSTNTLLLDLENGLRRGLQCLSGNGPMGRLHPYHTYQAHRLLELFDKPQPKTFQCVDDRMFATALATSPKGLSPGDPLYRQLSTVEHPAVIFDTFRLGGLLSRRYDDATYRNFFHLAEDQIIEHRNGQPMRPPNLHRYRDRASLVFHELVHWLGHEHSAIQPDLAHLYETCCFGGSDYIDDAAVNKAHQRTACAVLRDDELWSRSHYPYKQMRVWQQKGYDRFKRLMRADFSS